ncbi:MAG: hypothetical protein K6B28_04480 [Lachnospiraceae bacterium]|nr:hypothetical protein [Lachnospiraceae bacterium]
MNDLINKCRQNNKKIDEMMGKSGLSIDDWIELEGNRLKSNKKIKPLYKKDDLIDIYARYLNTRLPEINGANACDALLEGALHTANHLGGLYSPQSFQGDLYFGRLLDKQNKSLSCIPILSFGCVPINSSTYARGIMAHTESDAPVRIPLFSKNPPNPVASLLGPFDITAVKRAGDKGYNTISSYLVRKSLRRLINEVYSGDRVLSCKSFPDQVAVLAHEIYKRLPVLTLGKDFFHIEAEEIFSELFIKEASLKDSLLNELFTNSSFLDAINSLKDNEGRRISELLFRGCDREKRYFVLNLDTDGVLRGMALDGNAEEIPYSPEALKTMLRERQILPDVYLSWFMSGFLRGFTWYGGIFQSLYLPNWHELTLKALEASGFYDITGYGRDYDFSGYISGPICMLFKGNEGAVPAGPLEALAKTPSEAAYENLLKTDMKSAHEMGLYEFYNDLIPSRDKNADWFRTISSYEKEHHERNVL